jgi:hypothetical protein
VNFYLLLKNMFEIGLLDSDYLFDIPTKYVYVSLIPMPIDAVWCRSKFPWSDIALETASDGGDS